MEHPDYPIVFQCGFKKRWTYTVYKVTENCFVVQAYWHEYDIVASANNFQTEEVAVQFCINRRTSDEKIWTKFREEADNDVQ